MVVGEATVKAASVAAAMVAAPQEVEMQAVASRVEVETDVGAVGLAMKVVG